MIKKKLLLIGKSGFVSSKFQKILKLKNIKFQAIGSKDVNLVSSKSSKKLLNFDKNNFNYVIYFFSALTPDKGKDEFTFVKNIKMISYFFKYFPISKIKKFIYISSDAIYGNISNINDNTQPVPNDLYGSMHLVREKIIYSHLERSKVIILRPTAIFGFGDTHNSYGPNRFINQAINNTEIKLFGQGLDKRDHIFINDFVNILIALLHKKKYGAFVVASGKSVAFKSIALKIKQIIEKQYKKNVQITFIKNNNVVTFKNFNKIDKFILKNINNKKNIYSKIEKYISSIYK